MPSRRQEKIARVIKEAASEIISNRLSDPRIEGLVSITEVDTSPDLRNATIYLSILAPDEKIAARTFEAITHAKGYIQTEIGRRMTTRYYPKLTILQDKKVKKTLETLKLIDQAAQEYSDNGNPDDQIDIDTENGE